MRALRTGAAALVLSGSAGFALLSAVDAQTVPLTDTQMAPVSDAEFVRLAGQGNNEEIAEARLVLAHSKNPLVKQFAQKMLDDHSQAKVSLQKTAREVSATVPFKPGREMAMAGRQLTTLSGFTLDDAYMMGQIADHRKMLALLKSVAGSTQDASIKAFALAQQPIVESHLLQAQAYQVSSGTTLGDTPQVGNAVTPAVPKRGALNNGIPQSNGSSQNGGPDIKTGQGTGGSATGQTPAALPTTVPAPGTKPTAAPTTAP